MHKQIAIVTGASAGLGYEFAKQVDQKYQLDEIWLIARRKDRLEQIAALIKNAKPVIIQADLTKTADLQDVFTKLEHEKPQINLLINNAGFGKNGNFTDFELGVYWEMIDLNVKAVVAFCYQCLPYLQRGDGIINVASTAGYVAHPHLNVYAATKAFVLHFSLALRAELRDRGIKVLAVCPGPVKTEFEGVSKNNMQLIPHGADADKVVALALKDLAHWATSIYSWQYKIFVWLHRFIPKYWLALLIKMVR